MTSVIPCVFIIFLNVVDFVMLNMPPQPLVDKVPLEHDNEPPPASGVKPVVIGPIKLTPTVPSVLKNVTVTFSSPSTKGPNVQSNANTDSYIESGAVMRGVFVFVAITLLFITYLVFKTYRKGNRRHVAIKKYGVRARRTDTEMEPLHLDDEDEDETLFVRNASTR